MTPNDRDLGAPAPLMRYRFGDLPALLRTPLGRRQVAVGVCYRAWPLLRRLASLHRRTLARRTRVVAVVGSFGKTTTARATLAALGCPLPPCRDQNSFSFAAGAVLSLRPWDRHAVIEIGIAGPGQMGAYARMVRPDVTVVTSIGSEHQRVLGTLEATREEKAEMLRILPPTGLAVVNGDDSHIRWMREQTRARVVTFGFRPDNDLRATAVDLDWPQGMRFRLHAHGETRRVRTRLLGRSSVYAILAAVAVARGEGLGLDRVVRALESLDPAPGRLHVVPLANGAYLLRDDFKSPLETIDAALDTLAEIRAPRRIVVLGDVSELVGSQGPVYRRLGERVGQLAARAIFVTGRNISMYRTGARRGGLPPEAIAHARTVREAVAALEGTLQPGDVVLLKGRDTQRLGRIALALLGCPVGCEIRCCEAYAMECDRCPMLERGWNGVRVVI